MKTTLKYRVSARLVCPRCGGLHPEDWEFRQFAKPVVIEGWTFDYWAVCPATGEPVLAYDPEAEVALGRTRPLDDVLAEIAGLVTGIVPPTRPQEAAGETSVVA